MLSLVSVIIKGPTLERISISINPSVHSLNIFTH